MNILVLLKIEQDLLPTVSAYKKGYKTIALSRFNKLTLKHKLKYWEVLVLKNILQSMIGNTK